MPHLNVFITKSEDEKQTVLKGMMKIVVKVPISADLGANGGFRFH